MKKISFIILSALVLLFVTPHAFAEDSAGFTFPALSSPVSSYTFTYHNLTGAPVGVVSISTPGIVWSAISSPSCSTSHLYNGGTNPAVEGCNLAPGGTMTITATPASTITTEPSSLDLVAASYDTNSGFSTGQYNVLTS